VGKAELTLDLVPPSIGACMNPGRAPHQITPAGLKAGGTPAKQEPGSAPPPPGMQGYLFPNRGVPYSVIFDDKGTCTIVAGKVDVDATRASLDRLVIGSASVFDISQIDAKPRTDGESVVVEYRLTSKTKHGGLSITLSKVTREGKGTAVFLTRRIFGE
jgi:hypothetical protein